MNEREREVVEFDEAHVGTDGYVKTPDGVWFLYSDGCRRGVVCWGEAGCERVTPPADTKEARKWIKFFWELKLAELVDAFEDLRGRAKTFLAKSDGPRFNERVEQLKTLQTQIRSARSKLSHLTVLEKGFTQADVQRCWQCWQSFSASCAVESSARAKFENALLGKSSPGILEKLKHTFDEAKRHSERAMEKWNDFQPAEARAIVGTELDAERRRQRESELAEIEV